MFASFCYISGKVVMWNGGFWGEQPKSAMFSLFTWGRSTIGFSVGFQFQFKEGALMEKVEFGMGFCVGFMSIHRIHRAVVDFIKCY